VFGFFKFMIGRGSDRLDSCFFFNSSGFFFIPFQSELAQQLMPYIRTFFNRYRKLLLKKFTVEQMEVIANRRLHDYSE
jgi:hypothetical protein